MCVCVCVYVCVRACDGGQQCTKSLCTVQTNDSIISPLLNFSTAEFHATFHRAVMNRLSHISTDKDGAQHPPVASGTLMSSSLLPTASDPDHVS